MARMSPRSGSVWTAAAVAATILLAALPSASAGPRTPAWSRRAGDSLYAADAAPDGGTVVAGSREWRYRQSAMLLRRYGPDGALRWTRSWHPHRAGGKVYAWATAVAVASDGSVVVGGTLNPGCEGGGWFVRRYGPRGRLLWSREQSGWRRCRVATTLTGVAVSGTTIWAVAHDRGCCGDPFGDAFAMRMSFSGAPLGRTDIEVPGHRGRNEFVEDVAAGGLGNVYVIGRVDRRRPDRQGFSPSDLYVQKLSAGGGAIWTRLVRIKGTFTEEMGIAVRGAHLMAAANRFRDGGARAVVWLARLTFGGGIRWHRDLRLTARGLEALGVDVAPSGATYLVISAGRPRLRKYSPRGRLQWRGLMGPGGLETVGRDVAATADGAGVVGAADGSGRLWWFRA